MLWAQGLTLLVIAGAALPAAVAVTPSVPAGGSGGIGGARTAAVLLVGAIALVGAAAALVGAGLWRSRSAARPSALVVEVVLVAGSLSTHRPILIAVVTAIAVTTGAIVLSPAMARPARPEPPPDE
jgi:hypothetical protein